MYGELAKLGIDVVGESQLVGYPTQFPSVTMVDWNTGSPNARFQVLKLMHDNMGPGDRIIALNTDPIFDAQPIAASAYIRNGVRKVFLINRRAASASIELPGVAGGSNASGRSGERQRADPAGKDLGPPRSRLVGLRSRWSTFRVKRRER